MNINIYKKQANDFLKATNTEFKAEFLKKGLHFVDDEQTRDTYNITLKRNDRVFKFKFGDSIANTEKAKRIKPTAYDILSSLQKYDVGTFEDFCNAFGYSSNSIKANKVYKAVKKEYNNLKLLYNEEELDLLREIQ